MPLSKSASKEALQSNIFAEIDSSKPTPQAVAIGLGIQRRAKAAAKAAKSGRY